MYHVPVFCPRILSFYSDKFDLGDFSVAETKSRDWAAALFTHVVVERLTAAKLARQLGGSYYDYFDPAHKVATAVEAAMIGGPGATRRDDTRLVRASRYYRFRNGPMFFEYFDSRGKLLKQFVIDFKDGVMH